MVTTITYLKSINAYPIPTAVIEQAALKYGLDLNIEMTKEVLISREYALCTAEIKEWLSTAPNISQGGQSYSFSEAERKAFMISAQLLRQRYNYDGECSSIYGYKGSKL